MKIIFVFSSPFNVMNGRSVKEKIRVAAKAAAAAVKVLVWG